MFNFKHEWDDFLVPDVQHGPLNKKERLMDVKSVILERACVID